jgi:hypothetical protein
MAHGIEESIKIIGYADDWIIHTTHKHERVSVVKLQKAMDKIARWADNTGFQIWIEKTKAIMFSRKNTAIASRPTLDVWIKGMKIEQVRKQKILGLIFDTRMNWNEHILSIKAKAEKINIIKCLDLNKWGADQGNLLTIHKMIIRSSLRYGEEPYGSASKALLKKLEPTHNRGIRLVLGVFAVYRSMRSRGINTHRHEKPEYHNHSHQIHQQSPNMTILLKSNQTSPKPTSNRIPRKVTVRY